MKLIKILSVVAILFVAMAFGFRKNNTTEVVLEQTPIANTAAQNVQGPIGMSDDNQF